MGNVGKTMDDNSADELYGMQHEENILNCAMDDLENVTRENWKSYFENAINVQDKEKILMKLQTVIIDKIDTLEKLNEFIIDRDENTIFHFASQYNSETLLK